jgi:hypothetical protein
MPALRKLQHEVPTIAFADSSLEEALGLETIEYARQSRSTVKKCAMHVIDRRRSIPPEMQKHHDLGLRQAPVELLVKEEAYAMNRAVKRTNILQKALGRLGGCTAPRGRFSHTSSLVLRVVAYLLAARSKLGHFCAIWPSPREPLVPCLETCNLKSLASDRSMW